ncbi:hypothetical protein [Smaragdicoccus niigatensis]|uniref:hypothetical protein n=1 Tax=Smaragdicoccus niigatensis TaxID=359359 RepID=UPI00035E09C9|nr:hypothetical protein [Smaragdicoccus niigatensis]
MHAVFAAPRSATTSEWIRTVTLAEFVGFSAPAIAGALTVNIAEWIAFLILISAGTLEGLVLGIGQGSVAKHALPRFPRRAWVSATALGAGLAWLVAMLPSIFGDQLSQASTPTRIAVVALVGTIAVLSLSVPQWLVLRHVSHRASEWIAGSALGWCAGLTVFAAIAMPLWKQGQPMLVVVAIGLLAGLAMASTMATVTGIFFVRIVIDRSRS